MAMQEKMVNMEVQKVMNLGIKVVPFDANPIVSGKRGARYYEDMVVLNMHILVTKSNIAPSKENRSQSGHTRIYNAALSHLNDPFAHSHAKEKVLNQLASALARNAHPWRIDLFHGKRFFTATRNNKQIVIYDRKQAEKTDNKKILEGCVQLVSKNGSAMFQLTKNRQGNEGLSFSDIRLRS